ncbi:MAG: YqaA family protein [Chthoniobacterales bacterium]
MITSPDVVEHHLPKRNLVRRFYDWTMHWSETKYALPALFAISFAESSFFPIPPDVLLMAMCFSTPKKWWQYALWCTLASVLGGILGWAIGFYLWDMVKGFFFGHIPGFHEAAFNKMGAWLQQNGFWLIVAKGFTPIPYKLVTIAAGAFKYPLESLILASIFCRAGRFFLVAALIRYFGVKIRPFLEKYLDLVLFGMLILLVLGFVALKYLH